MKLGSALSLEEMMNVLVYTINFFTGICCYSSERVFWKSEIEMKGFHLKFYKGNRIGNQKCKVLFRSFLVLLFFNT